MYDLLFIATTLGFLGLSVAYTYACERLRGAKHD